MKEKNEYEIIWRDLPWYVKVGVVGGWVALVSFTIGFIMGLLGLA